MEIFEFIAFLTAAIALYCHHDLYNQIHETHELIEEYDFVIVGAGRSGSVVAHRLSEVEDWKILLIEAGGDENIISETPFTSMLLPKTELDWNYTTIEQKHICHAHKGFCEYSQGHVLGGSSTINDMVYVRGNKLDFDAWLAKGNPGWTYRDVLPYFIKLENTNDEVSQDVKYRGKKGPQDVQYPVHVTPLREKYIKAGVEYGLEEVDYNGKNQNGIGKLQVNMRGQFRASVAKCYLSTIKNRKNLHVIKNAHVHRVEFEDTTATKVLYYKDGKHHLVKVKKEVILSAGAINTPKILMLSGIGPKEHLESLKIPLLKDLAVGHNLQDHTSSTLFFSFKHDISIKKNDVFTNESIHEFAAKRTGILTTNGFEATAFINIRNKLLPPNIQLLFGTYYELDEKRNIVSNKVLNIHSKSRGFIRLSSKNHSEQALIDPNYFHHEKDFKTLKSGLEEMIKIMETPVMKELGAELVKDLHPKCHHAHHNHEYLDCVIKEYTTSYNHPVGTAKMGPMMDKSAVVSPHLFVYGFKNLRVVDASIMPRITRGNTNSPTIMIGEKGSDLIKKTHLKNY